MVSAPELAALVEKAKARRSTAATEANETSSRSHGVGVISVKQGECLGSCGQLLHGARAVTRGRRYVLIAFIDELQEEACEQVECH